MSRYSHLVLPLLVLSLAAWGAPCALAQAAAHEVRHAQHILGMEGIKNNAKGKLAVDAGTLRFQAGQASFSLPTSSITNVYTDQDSVKAVGAVAGTLSMAVPYGGGRFISLFRKDVDMLTVEYTDQNGGFHGTILRLPKGQGDTVKQWLVAAGARTSQPGRQL